MMCFVSVYCLFSQGNLSVKSSKTKKKKNKSLAWKRSQGQVNFQSDCIFHYFTINEQFLSFLSLLIIILLGLPYMPLQM